MIESSSGSPFRTKVREVVQPASIALEFAPFLFAPLRPDVRSPTAPIEVSTLRLTKMLARTPKRAPGEVVRLTQCSVEGDYRCHHPSGKSPSLISPFELILLLLVKVIRRKIDIRYKNQRPGSALTAQYCTNRAIAMFGDKTYASGFRRQQNLIFKLRSKFRPIRRDQLRAVRRGLLRFPYYSPQSILAAMLCSW